MNAHPRKSWVLSDPVARQVEALIEQGAVRDLDEVVQVALGVLLAAPDPEETGWMRREVLPAIEEADRDPSSLMPLDQAWAELEAHIARRRGAD